MKPKISVIVPLYNVERYVEQCACSLFEQTYEDMEFVFVNDASTDNTMVILKKTLARYSRRANQVILIENSINQGIATTRNIGLKAASGDYIGWVDGDDWVESTMFAEMLTMMLSTSSEIVCCDTFVYWTGKEQTYRIIGESSSDSQKILQSYLSQALVPLWCTLVDRRLYEKHHICFLEGQNNGEDLNVTSKLYYLSSKTSHLPRALYHYRYVRNSASTGLNDEKWKMSCRNIEDLDKFFHTKGANERILLLIKYRYLQKKQYLLHVKKDVKGFVETYPEVNHLIMRNPLYGIKGRLIEWAIYRLYTLIQYLLKINIY